MNYFKDQNILHELYRSINAKIDQDVIVYNGCVYLTRFSHDVRMILRWSSLDNYWTPVCDTKWLNDFDDLQIPRNDYWLMGIYFIPFANLGSFVCKFSKHAIRLREYQLCMHHVVQESSILRVLKVGLLRSREEWLFYILHMFTSWALQV